MHILKSLGPLAGGHGVVQGGVHGVFKVVAVQRFSIFAEPQRLLPFEVTFECLEHFECSVVRPCACASSPTPLFIAPFRTVPAGRNYTQSGQKASLKRMPGLSSSLIYTLLFTINRTLDDPQSYVGTIFTRDRLGT